MPALDERCCNLQAAEFGPSCSHARNDLQHRQRSCSFQLINSDRRDQRWTVPIKFQQPNRKSLLVGRGAEARNIAFIAQPSGPPGVPGFSGSPVSCRTWHRRRRPPWLNGRRRTASHRRDLIIPVMAYRGRDRDGTIGRWLEEADAIFAESRKVRRSLSARAWAGYIALLLLQKLLRDGRPRLGASRRCFSSRRLGT